MYEDTLGKAALEAATKVRKYKVVGATLPLDGARDDPRARRRRERRAEERAQATCWCVSRFDDLEEPSSRA